MNEASAFGRCPLDRLQWSSIWYKLQQTGLKQCKMKCVAVIACERENRTRSPKGGLRGETEEGWPVPLSGSRYRRATAAPELRGLWPSKRKKTIRRCESACPGTFHSRFFTLRVQYSESLFYISQVFADLRQRFIVHVILVFRVF